MGSRNYLKKLEMLEAFRLQNNKLQSMLRDTTKALEGIMIENMKLASLLERERQRDPVRRGRGSAYKRCVCGTVMSMDKSYYYKNTFYCEGCVTDAAIQDTGAEEANKAGREPAKQQA